MAITFAYRSDTSTTARYSLQGATSSILNISGYTYTSDVNAIGGNTVDLRGVSGFSYIGGSNIGVDNGISILMRIRPNYSGAPSSNMGIFQIGALDSNYSLGFYQATSNQIRASMRDETGTGILNGTGIYNWDVTTTQYYDFVWTYTNDTTNSGWKLYIDGILVHQRTTNPASWDNIATGAIKELCMGRQTNIGNPNLKYNEIVIWDEVIDPTNINLVSTGGVTSTAQTLNGTSRTGWVDVAALDAMSNSDPGIANVLSGTGYTIEGQSLTGTYATSNYTDPGIANVRLSTDYIFNDSTLTGTLSVPEAGAGTAGTLDIPAIKENIRYVLATNNTTTSSVLDLSASMSKRVKKVAKLHPEKIPIQATLYPAVTVFTNRKAVESATIAKNQLNGKRKSLLTLTIAGIVWNQNFSGDIFNDPAEQDLEYLMENIERVLRSYPNLNSNVTWQITSDVTYHEANFDEQTHMRVGLLDIEATVFY